MTKEELKEIEDLYIQADQGGPVNTELVIKLARGFASIGRLLGYIKELESQIPRWISVDERLPETWVNVITYSKKYGVLIDAFNIGEEWYYEEDLLMDITHWMPLPKGPEEK